MMRRRSKCKRELNIAVNNALLDIRNYLCEKIIIFINYPFFTEYLQLQPLINIIKTSKN
jgi:hypothetical protein